MSSALLRRSLAILEESLDCDKKKVAAKSKSSKSNSTKTQKSTTTKLACSSLQIKDKKNNVQIRGKQKLSIKTAIAAAQRTKSKVEENRQKLLMLDNELKMNDEVKETLLRRARSNRYVIPEKKEIDSTTAFTEEDFLKFEREYFVN